MHDLIPWGDFGSLSTSMDNFFNQVMSDAFGKSHKIAIGKSAYPRINTLEYQDRVIVEAAVPGLTKENVKVEWKDNILTIRGESNQSKEDGKYGYREIHKSSFVRSFTLDSEQFSVDEIDARVENGMLTITIPKFEPPVDKKPKQIDVK